MIEPRYRRFNYHPTCSQHLTNKMISKACLIFALLFAICEAIPEQFRPVYGQTPFHVPTGDVVDVAVGAGEFTTFAKLPAGTLESLTPEQAKEIILRHVVTAEVRAEAVTTGPVETIGGETINLVKTRYGGVTIRGPTTTVNVDVPNILATNGVIHRIDAVIL